VHGRHQSRTAHNARVVAFGRAVGGALRSTGTMKVTSGRYAGKTVELMMLQQPDQISLILSKPARTSAQQALQARVRKLVRRFEQPWSANAHHASEVQARRGTRGVSVPHTPHSLLEVDQVVGGDERLARRTAHAAIGLGLLRRDRTGGQTHRLNNWRAREALDSSQCASSRAEHLEASPLRSACM
jgi:hypothetical protein